jgi:hypothetical protein
MIKKGLIGLLGFLILNSPALASYGEIPQKQLLPMFDPLELLSKAMLVIAILGAIALVFYYFKNR